MLSFRGQSQASAVTTRVEIASGADDYTGIWRILNAGLLVCFFFLLPLAAFLKVFSPWVVMLFLGSEIRAQALLPIASPLLVIVAFFILANGVRVIAGQALNGLSDMRMPALMMGLGHWGIGFPAALVFGLGMDFGILGLWWGLTLGMAVIGILYLARFRWLVPVRTSLGERAGEWPIRSDNQGDRECDVGKGGWASGIAMPMPR
uniref:MatE protein n=1 Tax=Candidatus Kentrum sp. LPFa TaxID=2126335 RepID=A0A450WXM4_9GAMM|nr:MAG: MatE protein [Candidatus Kentron sp. LPFa]